MRLKKILLCIVLCVFITGCADKEYNRSSKSGKVIDITLSQMETKLENGDTFAIAFVTSYCNYCMQFHSIFNEYIKNHEVTLYQVILDNEATSEEENLAIILNYFPEFYSTPGIFYVEDGKEKDYLDLYNLGISEEVIDEWVVEFKMDEEN